MIDITYSSSGLLAAFSSSDFVTTLFASPSFFDELAALGLLCGLLVLPLLMVMMVRLRCRSSHSLGQLAKCNRGSVLAIDLIMVMVPFITILLVMLQSLWLARENVIVHYAAFNAARSARAHLCPPLPDSVQMLALQALGKAGCTGEKQRAETAARMALISASPPWGIPCLANCVIPENVIRAISTKTQVGAQTNAILDQAKYAFDPSNVKVEVGVNPAYLPVAAKPGGMVPVRAEVTFRHYILFGFGPVFGSRRADGYFYRESQAEVSLL